MGYFNYFLKCIIRNVAYKLCKPKVFLTVLLSVAILFILHSTGYCAEFTSSQITQLLNDVNGIITEIKSSNAYLSSLNVDTDSIKNDVAEIENLINSIENDTSNISSDLNLLLSKIDTVNNNLSNLYTQQNIYYESVTDELEEIKKILIGSDLDVKNVTLGITDYAGISPGPHSTSSFEATVISSVNMGYVTINYTFEGGYIYDIVCNLSSTSAQSHIYYTYDNVSVGNTIFLNYAMTGTPSRTAFSISPKKDSTVTLIFQNPAAFPGYNTWTITKKSSSSLSGISSTIEQGNQLQQESNQLQQEQNDFLKQESSDSDVSVDSFSSVDVNDITGSGLNGIFTTIYNSINNWNSKDIILPIPFTDKSLTIPSNYTSNMLNKVGGDLLINIISTVYYFIVARFIIYSITGIINSIKSGSILETNTKNNITTDML